MDSHDIYSLTEYVLDTHKAGDIFEIFNRWNEKRSVPITDFETTLWFIEYIKLLQNTDPAVIKTARKIDKKVREQARK